MFLEPWMDGQLFNEAIGYQHSLLQDNIEIFYKQIVSVHVLELDLGRNLQWMQHQTHNSRNECITLRVDDMRFELLYLYI